MRMLFLLKPNQGFFTFRSLQQQIIRGHLLAAKHTWGCPAGLRGRKSPSLFPQLHVKRGGTRLGRVSQSRGSAILPSPMAALQPMHEMQRFGSVVESWGGTRPLSLMKTEPLKEAKELID